MNKLLINLFILILLLTQSQFTLSIEVENLYRVKVPVLDQSSTHRWKASLDGFSEVLVRKSGSREILASYEVKQALSKVTSYLQRYEYNKLDDFKPLNTSTSDEPHNVSSSDHANKQPNYPYEIVLDFEPRLIDELIQAAGKPIWGSNRPLTILWLAMEQDFNRSIVNEQTEAGNIAELINQNATRRGIPLILPLMDLDDQLKISISDLWGLFDAPIIDASKRYDVDSIVSGRVIQAGEFWQAKLSFIAQGNVQKIELEAPGFKQLIASLTDNVAELLCRKYCVVEVAERHQVLMQIANLRKFNQFKQAENYLSAMASIRQVQVKNLADDHVQFNLSLLGDIQAVEDALILSKHLAPDPSPNSKIFAIKGPNLKSDPLQLNALHDTGTQDDINAMGETESQLPAPQLMIDEITAQNQVIDKQAQQPILYYRWID